MERSVEEIVSIYIQMRDKKKAIQDEADRKVAEIEEDMKVLTEHLLAVCNEAGADSIRTGAGTVMRGIKTRYWTSNWESLYGLIVDNDAFGLLEKRIQQTNMKQFLEDNPDLFPEGLNVDKEYTITIRRK